MPTAVPPIAYAENGGGEDGRQRKLSAAAAGHNLLFIALTPKSEQQRKLAGHARAPAAFAGAAGAAPPAPPAPPPGLPPGYGAAPPPPPPQAVMWPAAASATYGARALPPGYGAAAAAPPSLWAQTWASGVGGPVPTMLPLDARFLPGGMQPRPRGKRGGRRRNRARADAYDDEYGAGGEGFHSPPPSDASGSPPPRAGLAGGAAMVAPLSLRASAEGWQPGGAGAPLGAGRRTERSKRHAERASTARGGGAEPRGGANASARVGVPGGLDLGRALASVELPLPTGDFHSHKLFVASADERIRRATNAELLDALRAARLGFVEALERPVDAASAMPRKFCFVSLRHAADIERVLDAQARSESGKLRLRLPVADAAGLDEAGLVERDEADPDAIAVEFKRVPYRHDADRREDAELEENERRHNAAAALAAPAPAPPPASRAGAAAAGGYASGGSTGSASPRSGGSAGGYGSDRAAAARARAAAARARARSGSGDEPRDRFTSRFETPAQQPIFFNYTAKNIPRTPKDPEGPEAKLMPFSDPKIAPEAAESLLGPHGVLPSRAEWEAARRRKPPTPGAAAAAAAQLSAGRKRFVPVGGGRSGSPSSASVATASTASGGSPRGAAGGGGGGGGGGFAALAPAPGGFGPAGAGGRGSPLARATMHKSAMQAFGLPPGLSPGLGASGGVAALDAAYDDDEDDDGDDYGDAYAAWVAAVTESPRDAAAPPPPPPFAPPLRSVSETEADDADDDYDDDDDDADEDDDDDDDDDGLAEYRSAYSGSPALLGSPRYSASPSSRASSASPRAAGGARQASWDGGAPATWASIRGSGTRWGFSGASAV